MTDKNHCKSCGEWLEGYDICSQCGRINVDDNSNNSMEIPVQFTHSLKIEETAKG
jgi:hypothetical protein